MTKLIASVIQLKIYDFSNHKKFFIATPEFLKLTKKKFKNKVYSFSFNKRIPISNIYEST